MTRRILSKAEAQAADRALDAELEKEKAIIGQSVGERGFAVNIVEGDHVLYDIGASTCVIVILYDKENKRAAMAHIPLAEHTGRLQEVIDEMRSRGSRNIVSVMAGGSTARSKKAIATWRGVRETLRGNRDVIKSFKHGGLKDICVNTIALWIETGRVKYISLDIDKGRCVLDEFLIH